jgi:hypothetical protein
MKSLKARCLCNAASWAEQSDLDQFTEFSNKDRTSVALIGRR